MSDQGMFDDQRVYIGSFTSQGGRGITTASLDMGTGALTPTQHTEGLVPDPSALVRAPLGGVLYTVSETDDGAVAAFSLADPDNPVLLGEAVPVDGSSPTHLALADGRLFTANYGSGSVSALSLAPDGSLTTPVAVHQHEGSGPHPERQEGPHAHCVVPDPSGRWLVSADLGTDSLWIYEIVKGETGPRPHREVAMRPGTGPRHLSFHPNGDRLYLVNELDPTVTTCYWDTEDGSVRVLGETSTLPQGTETEGVYPSGLVLSGDGLYAWAANRSDDSLAVFGLNGQQGEAELLTTVPCGGMWPRALNLHPSGRWLYVANEHSGNVTWFTVEGTGGVPYRAGYVEVPAASWVEFG